MGQSKSYYRGEAIFSAGGVLVDKTSGKVLLIYKENTGEWLLPKGKMEKGELPEKTAKREIYEETGYKNKIKKFLSVQIRPDALDNHKTKVVLWFLSESTGDEKVENTQKKNEHFRSKWFEKDEGIKMLKWEDDKKLLEMVSFKT